MINCFTLLFVSLASLLMPARAELVFVGDAMQHQSQLDAARTASGAYDYSGYFSAVEPYIKSADFAVANLETPLGGKPYSGYPMFCSPDAYARALKDAGFDFLLTANNHMLDRRDRGLKRTVSTLDSLGIPHVGVYANSAERNKKLPMIVNVNGFRIAMLNYTYGTNGINIQGDVVVDYMNYPDIERDVAEARKAGAELVCVCLHWGEEYHLLPTVQQKRLADKLTDLGVDMIIGGHPHVIEPMEMRLSKRGNPVFLVYSLGNFISGMRTTDTRGGAMVRVVLERDSLGVAKVSDATYRLVFVVPPGHGKSNYSLLPAESPGPKSTEAWRKGFWHNAKKIFDRHNVNVPIDTLPIDSYAPSGELGTKWPKKIRKTVCRLKNK